MADNAIALGIQTPDSFKTIGGMLNFANQAQSLKTAQQEFERGGVALEKERALLKPGIAKGEAESRTAQEQSAQAEIATRMAKYKLSGELAQKARDIGQSLVSDPDVVAGNDQAIIPKIAGVRKMMVDSGIPPDVAEVQSANMMREVLTNPKGFKQYLLNSIQAGVGSSGQAANVRPDGVPVSNQQQTQVVNTNPFAGIPIGQPIPGTAQQQQLPPTTPVFNPQTNAPGYLGPQRTEVADEATALKMVQEATARGQPATVSVTQKPIQSGPALGQEKGVIGTVETVNKDWADTTAGAETASRDIGVLQNIKQYAPGAVTGVVSDRRAFTAGLAGLLGMDAAQMAKTETDKLAKNANMLALAGGNTDLARTLAEMANPNNKMTPEAIKSAANQVIAQKKLVLAKQSFLQPFKALNDPDVYSRALTAFNAAADPRILQLADMTPEEKTKMKAAMSETERAEFGDKIRKLQSLGIVK